MIMNDNKLLNTVYDFASVLLTALIAVSIIFTFFFKISTVVGESMENTLHNGEGLLITAMDKEIKNGDVVVISQPNSYDLILIKRVIGVGGQTISFDKKTKQVLVDGVAIKEDYIKESMIFFFNMNNTYVIPEGKLFVMGDNRNASADSRDPGIGMIDERYVVGTVFYRFGDKEFFES